MVTGTYFVLLKKTVQMNWVDLLLIAVLLVGAFLGWHRGFILGSMDLLAWAASFVLGYLFYPMVADLFSNWFDL